SDLGSKSYGLPDFWTATTFSIHIKVTNRLSLTNTVILCREPRYIPYFCWFAKIFTIWQSPIITRIYSDFGIERSRSRWHTTACSFVYIDTNFTHGLIVFIPNDKLYRHHILGTCRSCKNG